MLIQALLFFPPLICASIGLSRLVNAVQAYARLETRPTTPLGQLVEGEVEVEGILRAAEPIDAISHVPCAALKLRAAPVESRGSRRVYHIAKTYQLIGEATLEDPSGHRISIPETHEVSIQAPPYLGGEIPIPEIDAAWSDRFEALGNEDISHLAVEEMRIEDGAWVTIQGVAERIGNEESAYRGGATFRLVPPPGEPLLVFHGREAAARSHARLVCLGMTALLVVLLDIAYQAATFG